MPALDVLDHPTPVLEKDSGAIDKDPQNATKESPGSRLEGLKRKVHERAEKIKNQFGKLKKGTPQQVLEPEADELEALFRDLEGLGDITTAVLDQNRNVVVASQDLEGIGDKQKTVQTEPELEVGERSKSAAEKLHEASQEAEAVKQRMITLVETAYGPVDVDDLMDEINTPEAFTLQITALREAEEKGRNSEEGGISEIEAIAAKRALEVVGERLIQQAESEWAAQEEDVTNPPPRAEKSRRISIRRFVGKGRDSNEKIEARFQTEEMKIAFNVAIGKECQSLRREIGVGVEEKSRQEATALQQRYTEIIADIFEDGSMVDSVRESFIKVNIEPELEAAVIAGNMDKDKRSQILTALRKITDEGIVDYGERRDLLKPFMAGFTTGDYRDDILFLGAGVEYFGVQQLVSGVYGKEADEIIDSTRQAFTALGVGFYESENAVLKFQTFSHAPNIFVQSGPNVGDNYHKLSRTEIEFEKTKTDESISKPALDVWGAVRTSTATLEVFSDEIREIDDSNRTELLKRILSEGGDSLIPALTVYASEPEITKALALLEACDIYQAGEVIERLKRGGKWQASLDMAENQSPGIKKATTELRDTESLIHQVRNNRNALMYIFQRPESIGELRELIDSGHGIFELFKEGGPLNTTQPQVLKDLLSHGEKMSLRADQIENIFTSHIPQWKKLFLFVETNLGEKLTAAESSFPIKHIPEVVQAGERDFDFTESLEEVADLSLERKREIAHYDDMNYLTLANLSSIPFNRLKGEYKRYVFANLIKETIDTSRDEGQKATADERNRAFAADGLQLQIGIYIHGAAIDFHEGIMLNGNLAGEALGESANDDLYPFHVDFSVIQDSDLQGASSPGAVIERTITGSFGYGYNGELGRDGQVIYVYQRKDSSWQSGINHYANNGEPDFGHTLMLGGIPATEISGMVLKSPDATLTQARKAIVENGFYVPIFDMQGKLLFTPEEYDRTVEDLNLKVGVEVLDDSLKTGDQLGSNKGGTFYVPTESGPKESYVKFGESESTDQIWNEQLADNIYRHLGIPVPDTRIVKVDGSYGHASQILPLDSENRIDDLKNGFIVDALLANWDIIDNSENTATSDGKLIRIDNGGSLLFKPQGDRNPQFGAVVTELDIMKGGYPGISTEDIQAQLVSLQERFTDTDIDQLVDSVRLNRVDRDYLKTTLRQRRDYILNYYNEEQVELREAA